MLGFKLVLLCLFRIHLGCYSLIGILLPGVLKIDDLLAVLVVTVALVMTVLVLIITVLIITVLVLIITVLVV